MFYVLICHSVENVVDPNSTVSNEEWLNHWPSYFTIHIKPSCQAEDVQVNTSTSLNRNTEFEFRVSGLIQSRILHEPNCPHVYPDWNLDNSSRTESSCLANSYLS